MTPTLQKTAIAAPAPAIRARTYLVGLPLLIGVCLLSVYADMAAQVVQVGIMQLAPPAIGVLLLLALVTKIGRTRNWLSGGELAIIYAMCLVGTLVSTRGVIEKLIPSLTYLPYFANRANGLNQTLGQHLPSWAMPFVPGAELSPAMAAYWEGNGGQIPWNVWIGPLVAWFALIMATLWVFLCLATLLRRQWMDNEQLRFPLTILPLAVIEDRVEGQPFFRNGAMWLGFGTAFGVFLLNGLHANFPDFPYLTLQLDLGSMFTERPWNTAQNSPVFLSFAAIGFAYFLPADLLFSLWFFFILTRFQDVAITQAGGLPTGIGTHGTNIFQGYQAAGAYLVFVLVQLKITWPYFRRIFASALGRSARVDDAEELVSYRIAVWGLLLGFAFIIGWLWLAGMNPFLAGAQMGLFLFFIAIVMTRAVCEAGMLGTETSFLPSHLINLVTPLPVYGPSSLAMLGMTDAVFTRDLRGMLLSTFLDGQKIVKTLGMRPRQLLGPLVIACVLSFVAAGAFFLWLHYERGALSLYNYPQWNAANLLGRAASAASGNPPPAGGIEWGGLSLGAVVMGVLMLLRARFSWFMLNPLGYALAPMGTMNVYWFPFFVAWIIKSGVLKFGGVDIYRRLAPFMLGLVLGEFSAGLFWLGGNLARGWAVPSFPWP